MTLANQRDLRSLYLRQLEVWGRAVVDEQDAFLQAFHDLGRKAQAEGLVGSHEWEFDRWFTKAHLLLVCVRNVWRYACSLRTLDSALPGVEHIPVFEGSIGTASEFRDFLEHFDDYARGVGRAQKKGRLPRPDELGGMAMETEQGFQSIEYTFGGLRINLDEAVTAATLLAQMFLGKQLIRPEREVG